jgi:hypothetical protein
MAQQPAQNPSSPAPQSTPAQPNPGAHQLAPSPQPAPSAQPQDDSKSAAVPAPSTANAPEATNAQLRPVTGELEKKLDSKNAKAGDPVVVKTTENATTASGMVIPKGSLIMGHVTDVQPHDKTNENARLTLEFDQAQLKGGQTLPIKTVLESVSPAEVNVRPTDTLNSQPSAPAAAPAGAMAGGVPGGSSSGSRTSSASASGSSSASSTAGSAPAMSSETQDQAAAAAPKTGTVVARQGNVTIMTTALPGVLLATNANGQPFSNASGALLGAKQNVHLDGGTEFVLAVADAAPKPMR